MTGPCVHLLTIQNYGINLISSYSSSANDTSVWCHNFYLNTPPLRSGDNTVPVHCTIKSCETSSKGAQISASAGISLAPLPANSSSQTKTNTSPGSLVIMRMGHLTAFHDNYFHYGTVMPYVLSGQHCSMRVGLVSLALKNAAGKSLMIWYS